MSRVISELNDIRLSTTSLFRGRRSTTVRGYRMRTGLLVNVEYTKDWIKGGGDTREMIFKKKWF